MQRLIQHRLPLKLLWFVPVVLLLIAVISGHTNIASAARTIYGDWGTPIVLQPHQGAVTSLAFSPDNQWLATGGENGETHLWSLNTESVYQADFARLAAETTDPNGHNVREHCGGDFSTASATIAIDQDSIGSTVRITLNDARPETLYTSWLRVKGTTLGDDGIDFGSSPFTGAGSTPLAASSAIETLLAITESSGMTEVVNGFWTDLEGHGELIAELDFPILGGAYPFHHHDDSLAPLAIVGAPFAPFMIRIASHCTDGMGHGLSAGNREPWFDWSPQ